MSSGEATSADILRAPARATSSLITEAFVAAGLPAPDAVRCAELMTQADLTGADGHGIFRLPQYVRRLKGGGFNKRPNITVSRTAPATALVDGDNGMGHLVMLRAADEAIAMARDTGVAWVGVRRSNHAGPAGLYAEMPAAHGMVGLYAAVANANHMATWGGADLLLGTNPLAIGVPTGDRPLVRHGDFDRRLRHGQKIRAARPDDARRLVRRYQKRRADHRSKQIGRRAPSAHGGIQGQRIGADDWPDRWRA
jgi:hypothetical protein